MRSIAVLLITMGIMATTFTGYTTIAKNEIARIEIVSQQKTRVYMTTAFGALLTISGLIMLVVAKKKSAKRMSRSFY
ncbi:MAG TPA: hypothetical protein VIY47_01645 [Ignavibacteriaceae bacterium]